MTRDARSWLAGSGLERVDALALLRELAGIDHARLLAHPDTPLEPAVAARLDAAAARVRAGEPLAYVLGWREFHGLRLAVDAAVLVPRPDTELLVEFALEQLPLDAPARVLDLGTGSGAIAVAIAHARPRAEVWAVDLSADALRVAAANAAALLDAHRPGGALRLLQGDWLDALPPRADFDLIVANPPYIAADDPHLPALRHEPALALVGAHPNADGLDDLRRLIPAAAARLRPGGWLALEHGWDQAGAVRALLAAQGLEAVHSRLDLAAIERIGAGRRAPVNPAPAGSRHGA